MDYLLGYELLRRVLPQRITFMQPRKSIPGITDLMIRVR